jgi:hypothetical protein
MLLLVSVYLFRVLHRPAQYLKEWSYNEQNRDFPYAAAVSKETNFTSLLNVIGLKFLDQEFLLQLFPNCDNFCLFPDPSIVGKRDKILLVTLTGF